MTAYQLFITQSLRGIAHTNQTTKAAWNASLDNLKSLLAEIEANNSGAPLSVYEINHLIERQKEP